MNTPWILREYSANIPWIPLSLDPYGSSLPCKYHQAPYIPFHLSVFSLYVHRLQPSAYDDCCASKHRHRAYVHADTSRLPNRESRVISTIYPDAGSLPPDAGCQQPDPRNQPPDAGCLLKKSHLVFQQSGFFIPCRGRELIAAECCLCCLLNHPIPCFRVHPCHPWAVISPCRWALLAKRNVVYVVFQKKYTLLAQTLQFNGEMAH